MAITAESGTPLGTGLPTKAELLAHYPSSFTWAQLKTFVNSGDLGLLKRNKKLQKRYMVWSEGIKQEYGSIVNYLLSHRLQWGKPDTLSLMVSALDSTPHSNGLQAPSNNTPRLDFGAERPSARSADAGHPIVPELPPLPEGTGEYFTADSPPELISVIQNDWPYAVPPEIEHTLVWTRLPIIHPALVAPAIRVRVAQDGLWGFTGSREPPPSPSALPACLPALAEWGVTEDRIVRSAPASAEERALLAAAAREVDAYVRARWREDEWETAWFVNPPRLQSVPGLAHIHVFARKKSPEEVAAWS